MRYNGEKEREVCNMQVVLENEALKVTINSFGAELASIRGKATDTEYLWNADAKFWKRTGVYPEDRL